MRIRPKFTRNQSTIALSNEIEFELDSVSWIDVWKENECRIVASVPQALAYSIPALIGAEVYLQLDGTWRGVVERVSWRQGGERTLELTETATSVAVLYEKRINAETTEQALTTWHNQNDQLFGLRQLVYSAPTPTSESEAEALAERIVQESCRPQFTIEIDEDDKSKQKITAEIICVGLFKSRCATRYYRRLDGIFSPAVDSGGKNMWCGWSGTLAAGTWCSTGDRRIHSVNDEFVNLPKDAWVKVSGVTMWDGRYQVSASSSSPTVTFTGSVQFIAPDRILVSDAAFLSSCAPDDVVFVSGSIAANNGFHRIERVLESELRIRDSFASVQNHTGSSVTLKRCTFVEFARPAPGGVILRNTINNLTLTMDGASIYQRFVAPPWSVGWVEVNVAGAVGEAPALNVTLHIDDGGAPGAALGMFTLSAAQLANGGWQRGQFVPLPATVTGNVYGISIAPASSAQFAAWRLPLRPRSTSAQAFALLSDGAAWWAYDAAVGVRLIGADYVGNVLAQALQPIAQARILASSADVIEIRQEQFVSLFDFVDSTMKRFPSLRLFVAEAGGALDVVLGAAEQSPPPLLVEGGKLYTVGRQEIKTLENLVGRTVVDGLTGEKMRVAFAEWRQGKWLLSAAREKRTILEQG